MTEANVPATLVGDREIMSSRIYDAPRDLVFKMWTDAKHLDRWWGPKGFTTTTFKQEVKPGGVWRFVMHGPDGKDYENKITYVDIVPNQKLVYKHGGDKDLEPVNFTVTTTFEDAGDKTKLTMRMVFPSAVARDLVIKTYGAAEGLNQTLGRLDETLAHRNEPPSEFVITRTFDAPRDLVWKAWTERERLMQWFGPKGFTMTEAKLDLRPGGTLLYCLRGPDGKEMWGKFNYREVVPPRRIVLVQHFCDKDGGKTRHPFSPTWPQEMLTTTTLAEYEGRTTITVRWSLLDATPEERKTFDTSFEGMTMGWSGTFDQLAEYLKNA